MVMDGKRAYCDDHFGMYKYVESCCTQIICQIQNI